MPRPPTTDPTGRANRPSAGRTPTDRARKRRSIPAPGWRGNGKAGALRRLGLSQPAWRPPRYHFAYITRRVRGGKFGFMELAELAAESHPWVRQVVEVWNSLAYDDQRRVALEDVCAAAEIPPEDFLGPVIGWAYKNDLDVSELLAAIICPLKELALMTLGMEFGGVEEPVDPLRRRRWPGARDAVEETRLSRRPPVTGFRPFRPEQDEFEGPP